MEDVVSNGKGLDILSENGETFKIGERLVPQTARRHNKETLVIIQREFGGLKDVAIRDNMIPSIVTNNLIVCLDTIEATMQTVMLAGAEFDILFLALSNLIYIYINKTDKMLDAIIALDFIALGGTDE